MKHITEFNPDFDKRPLSASSLKAFQKSPQHFIEYRTTRKAPTPAMAFGNILDCLILTPDDYEKKFVVMPEDIKKPTSAQAGAAKPSLKTLDQIAKYDTWTNENRGKTWIEQDDYDLASFLADKTFKNEKAAELLSRVSRTQDKLDWVDPITGLPLIGFKDATGDTFILDLKSAADGSPEGFQSAAYKLGYHIQTGTYLEAEKVLFHKYPDFFHLVVETVAPYNISVFKADADFIELGKQEYRFLLDQVKFCNENNLWYQGYEFHSAVGYHQLGLPGWAKNKLNKYK